MSGDLPRAAEEEDKRLLMPASGGCFRLVVDVERLSAKSREKNKQGRRDLHRRPANREGISGAGKGLQASSIFLILFRE